MDINCSYDSNVLLKKFHEKLYTPQKKPPNHFWQDLKGVTKLTFILIDPADLSDQLYVFTSHEL